MLETILDGWRQFMEFEFAHETLMGLGAFLIVASFWRIVKSSFRLVVWVIFAAIGGLMFSYGMNRTTYDVQLSEITDIADLSSNISLDTFKLLCSRFTE